MRHLLFALTASLVVVYASATVNAAALVYNVSDSVGAGNVTGSIQTDGTLGVLSQANITDWNLHLNDGSRTFDLLGPSSGSNSGLLISQSSFTATNTGLFFDFSTATGAFVDFKNPPAGSALNYLCLQDSLAQCSSDASDFVIKVDPDGEQITRELGNVQVASRATAAPEPPTVALLIPALAGLAFFLGGCVRRLN